MGIGFVLGEAETNGWGHVTKDCVEAPVGPEPALGDGQGPARLGENARPRCCDDGWNPSRAGLCDIGNPELVGVCPRTLSFQQITRLSRLVACSTGTPLAWNSLKASARHR